MWIHNFKNFMAHKISWHAMTNIGAINSRHTKHMVSQKIMDFHENLWHLVTKQQAMSSSHGKLNHY